MKENPLLPTECDLEDPTEGGKFVIQIPAGKYIYMKTHKITGLQIKTLGSEMTVELEYAKV